MAREVLANDVPIRRHTPAYSRVAPSPLMTRADLEFDFDVAIVGGGPAGLSAAVVLGRSRRSVALFDHGKPRNYAAQAVHCYLGLDDIEPSALRDRGRKEAESYGVQIFDTEVTGARCLPKVGKQRSGFQLQTRDESIIVRTLLLTTGVIDELPVIPGFREFYGRSVHHCPYCDGWEHRDEGLVAFADGKGATELALELRTWSPRVTACSNGSALREKERQCLARNGIAYREDTISRFDGTDGSLLEIVFESGSSLRCDALFFSAGQCQRSPLAAMLGCDCDEKGLVQTGKKQESGIKGLFLAGDADGEVQFAIVAAAEGAVAATAINRLLQEEDAI